MPCDLLRFTLVIGCCCVGLVKLILVRHDLSRFTLVIGSCYVGLVNLILVRHDLLRFTLVRLLLCLVRFTLVGLPYQLRHHWWWLITCLTSIGEPIV